MIEKFTHRALHYKVMKRIATESGRYFFSVLKLIYDGDNPAVHLLLRKMSTTLKSEHSHWLFKVKRQIPTTNKNLDFNLKMACNILDKILL